MDPRAIGAWDFAALNATEEAVWAMDAEEAGVYGKGGRPPPNEDGTPAETLADQVVRLTNLMSVCETLYSGDTVLLVFPDGTGPALLSCLIGGIPLSRVHELQFRVGEIRCDVDYNSINAMASPLPSRTYLDVLQRGKVELEQLRENPDMLRNVKDLKYEEEREQERKELEAKREDEEKAKELERQRKREEGLQMKNNTLHSSLDVSSLGIAGAIVGGVAVATSVLGGDETEEAVNGGNNATGDVDIDKKSSFNSTAPVIDPETDAILIDGQLEGPMDSLSNVASVDTPKNDAFDASLNGDETEQNDVDYNDWGDAWLGTISEIMDDDDDNQN